MKGAVRGLLALIVLAALLPAGGRTAGALCPWSLPVTFSRLLVSAGDLESSDICDSVPYRGFVANKQHLGRCASLEIMPGTAEHVNYGIWLTAVTTCSPFVEQPYEFAGAAAVSEGGEATLVHRGDVRLCTTPLIKENGSCRYELFHIGSGGPVGSPKTLPYYEDYRAAQEAQD